MTAKKSSNRPATRAAGAKKSTGNTRDKGTAARAASRKSESAPSRAKRSAPNDLPAQQAAETQAVAASIPFNATKASEYSNTPDIEPTEGEHVDVPGMVSASTLAEANGNEKTGDVPEVGDNPTNGALTRVRVRSDGQTLTTNQGVRVADNQNSLKAGLRGPALLKDFILREKITHFDHERIPERIVHARGSGAHGYFEAYEALGGLTMAAPFRKRGKRTPVSCASRPSPASAGRKTRHATCAALP